MPSRRTIAILLLLSPGAPAFASAQSEPVPIGVSCEPVGAAGSLLPEGITVPSLEVKVEPIDPRPTPSDGPAGRVVFNATICRDGIPRRIELVSEKPEGLRDAAFEAFRRWRYRPATLDGVPVALRIAVQVTFGKPTAAAEPLVLNESPE